MRLLEEHGAVRGYECRMKRKDATPVWVSLNVRIVRSADGKALFYEGFIEDISARKRSEQALLASEQRYRRLFDNSPDAILLTNPDGSGRRLIQPPARCSAGARRRSAGWAEGVVDRSDPRLALALEDAAPARPCEPS